MSFNKVLVMLDVILAVTLITVGSFFGYRYWKGYYVPVEVASQVSNKQLKIADIFSLENYLKEIGFKTPGYWKRWDDRKINYGVPSEKIKVVLTDKYQYPLKGYPDEITDRSAKISIVGDTMIFTVQANMPYAEATKYINEQFMMNVELKLPQEIDKWKVLRKKYLEEKTFFKVISK